MADSENTLAPFEDLGFVQSGKRGREVYGTCVFCGKARHLHINVETQKWSCKSGACGLNGNLTTFLEEWLALQERGDAAPWKELAKERGIRLSVLKGAGLAWDGSRWCIPVYSKTGRLQNIRFYNAKARKVKMRGVTGIPLELYGAEELADPKKAAWPVWVCEGEFDRLAMKQMLSIAKAKAVVTAVPGAGTFKTSWAEALQGRDLRTAYDNDMAGRKGNALCFKRCSGRVNSYVVIRWPEALPPKFDVRDFNTHVGKLAQLEEWLHEYEDEGADTDAVATRDVISGWPKLSEGKRPPLEETLNAYGDFLQMTQDMRDAIRIIYAVVICKQMQGDPLWFHIVAVPGGSKTELLLSCSKVGICVYRSTVTAHGIVSGYAGGKDPSLIPKLIGKVFILKDWTEVLNLPYAEKHQIYGIFRGAYDGRVEKSFGNGVNREYEGHFNMVTGVTPEVFRETGAALGERFLNFYMSKDITAYDATEVIERAISNVGDEDDMREQLSETAKVFLEHRIERADVPKIPADYIQKLTRLAQLVAMLRASVSKERFAGETRILYRPQHELATRLGKQFAKLLIGLGLQNNPPVVSDEEYRIVVRVARDTCIGWNMDAIEYLMKNDGKTTDEIAESANIPKSTLREQLEELVMLGVLDKEKGSKNAEIGGRRPMIYHVSEVVKEFWGISGVDSGDLPEDDATVFSNQNGHLNGKIADSTRKMPMLRKRLRAKKTAKVTQEKTSSRA